MFLFTTFTKLFNSTPEPDYSQLSYLSLKNQLIFEISSNKTPNEIKKIFDLYTEKFIQHYLTTEEGIVLLEKNSQDLQFRKIASYVRSESEKDNRILPIAKKIDEFDKEYKAFKDKEVTLSICIENSTNAINLLSISKYIVDDYVKSIDTESVSITDEIKQPLIEDYFSDKINERNENSDSSEELCKSEALSSYSILEDSDAKKLLEENSPDLPDYLQVNFSDLSIEIKKSHLEYLEAWLKKNLEKNKTYHKKLEEFAQESLSRLINQVDISKGCPYYQEWVERYIKSNSEQLIEKVNKLDEDSKNKHKTLDSLGYKANLIDLN